MKSYSGIGSRDISKEVWEAMVRIGSFLGKQGYTLRSGGADGSDMAFETGCDRVNGKKEIYLPWLNFNNNKSDLQFKIEAYGLAQQYHPNYNNLSNGAKKLMARNCHQVLGHNLKEPVDFIICYTPNGSGRGGTGQALRIASKYGIPVFDFGKYNDIETAKHQFNKFWKEMC